MSLSVFCLSMEASLLRAATQLTVGKREMAKEREREERGSRK
jgi:hypothetical protein